MFFTNQEGYEQRFECLTREKLMEDVLQLRDTKTTKSMLFESMVYARTIETKDHAYEVCPQIPFAKRFFCSIFVFILHHFCTYNKRQALEDINRRMKAQDRYVKAVTFADKQLLIEAIEKASRTNSLAALMREICTKPEAINVASKIGRFVVWNMTLLRGYLIEEDPIMKTLEEFKEFEDCVNFN